MVTTGGIDSNFRTSYRVTAGIYYAVVQHYLGDQVSPYTITSNFATGDSITVSPAARAVSGAGGTFDFTVNNNSTWNWTSNAAWVTVAGEAGSQNGPQTFTYAVAPQTAATARDWWWPGKEGHFIPVLMVERHESHG